MSHTKEHRPGGQTEAMHNSLGATASLRHPAPDETLEAALHSREPLVSYRFEAVRAQLGQVAARLIEEVLLAEVERQRVDGLPSTWDRRADEYDDAGEHGKAEACRCKAAFLRMYPELSAEAGIREAVRDALALPVGGDPVGYRLDAA